MAEQFKEQGGASTMDPGPVRRWLVSRVMSRMSSPQWIEKRRAKAEKRRVAAAEPLRVEYFHQVDDGYSHLAAQVLPNLAARYDIDLVCHLVYGPQGRNLPEPELLPSLAQYDATLVAPEYGLTFPQNASLPSPALIDQAAAILAAQADTSFRESVVQIGEALWSGNAEELNRLAGQLGAASQNDMEEKLTSGTDRRRALKHYSGAMFYCAEEWYWGVDRLYHLEQRLSSLGLDRRPEETPLVPRPAIEIAKQRDNGSLTLEMFPSLRSPYTAISFDRTVQLARDSGVRLVVRPVLPMVMRGVPATNEKGVYIFTDTAREARAAGVPFGNFYDPIGDPVRRAYSLYAWAVEQGKGIDLLSSFLRCAFAEGVNTNNDRGMKRVVAAAGLDWEEARQHLGETGWESMVEENRLAMYDAGLWGVPSFRLFDAQGNELLSVWGQDRLWLIARVIARQLTQAG